MHTPEAVGCGKRDVGRRAGRRAEGQSRVNRRSGVQRFNCWVVADGSPAAANVLLDGKRSSPSPVIIHRQASVSIRHVQNAEWVDRQVVPVRVAHGEATCAYRLPRSAIQAQHAGAAVGGRVAQRQVGHLVGIERQAWVDSGCKAWAAHSRPCCAVKLADGDRLGLGGGAVVIIGWRG